jgi:hypothetical protein
MGVTCATAARFVARVPVDVARMRLQSFELDVAAIHLIAHAEADHAGLF